MHVRGSWAIREVSIIAYSSLVYLRVPSFLSYKENESKISLALSTTRLWIAHHASNSDKQTIRVHAWIQFNYCVFVRGHLSSNPLLIWMDLISFSTQSPNKIWINRTVAAFCCKKQRSVHCVFMIRMIIPNDAHLFLFQGTPACSCK